MYERQNKQQRIEGFMQTLEQREGLLKEFDEKLWNAVINTVRIVKDESIEFIFKG